MKAILALFLIVVLATAQEDPVACENNVNTIVNLCESLNSPSPTQILDFIPIFGYELYQIDQVCGLNQDLEFFANPEFEIDPVAFLIPQCDINIKNLIESIINIATNPPTGQTNEIDAYVGLFEYLNAVFLDCNAIDAPEEIIEFLIEAITDGELMDIANTIDEELTALYPDMEQYAQDFTNGVASIADQAGEDIVNTADQTGEDIENTADQTGEDITNTANQTGEDITNTADQTGEDIENTADQTGEDIENTANQAGEDITNTANQAGEDITNAGNQVDEEINNIGNSIGNGISSVFGGGWRVARKMAKLYRRFEN